MSSDHNKIIKGYYPKIMRIKLNFTKNKSEILTIFFRQFYVLIKAGIPIIRALQIIADSTHDKEFKDVLTQIIYNVSQKGMRLHKAVEKQKDFFGLLHIAMIKAGEESGSFGQIIEQLAIYHEKELNLRKKIGASLVYPCAVVIVSIIVMYALARFVLPLIISYTANSYSDKELPLATKLVLIFAQIIESPITLFAAILIVVGVIYIFMNYVKTPVGRLNWDSFKIRIPLAGQLLLKSFITQFCTMMYALNTGGVPLVKSLNVVAESGSNMYLCKKIESDVINGIEHGLTVSQAFESARVFPPLVICLLRTGEEAGEISLMLRKITNIYEMEIDIASAQLTALIEPVVITFLGGLACLIALAAFIPIYQIMTKLG